MEKAYLSQNQYECKIKILSAGDVNLDCRSIVTTIKCCIIRLFNKTVMHCFIVCILLHEDQSKMVLCLITHWNHTLEITI